MPAVPYQRVSPQAPPAGARERFWNALRRPPGWVEGACWLLLAAWMVGVRWWLAVRFPAYVWTRDSGSYLAPALSWLQTGQWVTSARRGPGYSLFLAAVCKAGGTLTTAINIQAALGALTALATVAAARAWGGRRAFWPLLGCGVFYALYGMPLELERLVRNETLLALFTTAAFGGWFFALKTGSRAWMAASGLASGAMQLLKGIFPVFPLLVLVLTCWNWRRAPWRAAALSACYVLPFVLPLAGSKAYDRFSGTGRPPEPEAGEMLYGRTAQWTVLDGGIEPDIKTRIRPQVETYADRFRRTGHLDNNEIVKRTVVPTLKTILVQERRQPVATVDRLCWRLAFEAVRHHPGPYLKQAAQDFFHLNFITAQRFVVFLPKTLQTSVKDARDYLAERRHDNDPNAARVFDLPAEETAIREAARHDGAVARFSRFTRSSGHLRLLSPAFLTGLCLPLLVWLARGRDRLFWLGMTVLWYYYLALLSTVGRPLDRYLMPVVPVMFWTLATAAAIAWSRLGRTAWIRRRFTAAPG